MNYHRSIEAHSIINTEACELNGEYKEGPNY